MPKMAFKHQEKVVSFCVVILAYWYRAVCSSYISIYQVETIFPFTEIRVYKIISQSFFFFWPCHETCKILVLYPGMEPMIPAVEAQSLNHWTTREIPTEEFESSKMTDCLTLQGRMNFQLWLHGTARSNGRRPTIWSQTFSLTSHELGMEVDTFSSFIFLNHSMEEDTLKKRL